MGAVRTLYNNRTIMIASRGGECQQKRKAPCPGEVLYIKIAIFILFSHGVVGGVKACLLTGGAGCIFRRGGRGCLEN